MYIDLIEKHPAELTSHKLESYTNLAVTETFLQFFLALRLLTTSHGEKKMYSTDKYIMLQFIGRLCPPSPMFSSYLV